MEPQHLPTKRVIRRCPFCGARINPDDTSCPVCGEALIQILSPRAATSSQTTSRPQQQLPPPRTLGGVRQQSLVSTKNSRESVRTAQSLTTHQRRSIRPIETIYVQCPSCGARNGVADMHCNVCGQMFSSVMPVSRGPLEDPPPIAMWSPRLQRAMPPHRHIPTTAQLPKPQEPIRQASSKGAVEQEATRPPDNTINTDSNPVLARTNLLGTIATVAMSIMMLSVGIFLLYIGNLPIPTVNALPIAVQPASPRRSSNTLRTPIVKMPLTSPTTAVQIGYTPTTGIPPSPAIAPTKAPVVTNAALDANPTPVILEFYASPTLLAPIDGAQIASNKQIVVLKWRASRPLNEHEFFVVQIQPLDAADTPAFRTQSNELKVQPGMLGNTAESKFTWWIKIQRQMGIDPNTKSPIYQDLSPLSNVRHFTWFAKS